MPKFVITGGKTARGEISIPGSKNIALHLLAVAQIFKSCTFINIPNISDIKHCCNILSASGVEANVS